MESQKNNEPRNKSYYILFFMAIILTGFLLKTLSSVVIPIIITILIAFALYPLIDRIHSKTHIPWALVCILLILAVLILLIMLSSLLITGLSTIIVEYPKYESRFLSIYKVIAENLGLHFNSEESFLTNLLNIVNIKQLVKAVAGFLSGGVVSAGKAFILVVLMLIFLLIEIKSMKERFVSSLRNSDKVKITGMIKQIITDVTHFLSIKLFISIITGILIFFITLALGMDFPIVWGFIAFIMNFIPTFGSIFSTIVTTLFCLLQFYPGYGKVIIIFISMIVINFGLGNVLEPRIEGNRLGLSPFAILVCLSFWGWMWGFTGLIIAVPMTVIIKIICENIPYLNWFANLLGKERKNE